MQIRARSMTAVWLWSIAIWSAFGLINGTQVVVGMQAQGMDHPWARLFFAQAISWAVWAIASPLVFMLGKKYEPARHWGLHVGAYVLVGIIDAAWVVSLQVLMKPLGAMEHEIVIFNLLLGFFYSRFAWDLIAYAGVLALGRLMESSRTLAERDAQLAQARLDALRRQLEPHFLFNTLNGIAGLVRSRENDTAVDMIAGLSALLRRVVDGPPGLETTLAEEVEFLEKYVALQRMRFATRLDVSMDIPGELSGARVPSMILQPIVENAILHGVENQVAGGAIRISARRVNEVLTMRVENSGPRLGRTREGVGIANTRARLRSLYGDGGRFDLRNGANGQVEAVVSVPYQMVS